MTGNSPYPLGPIQVSSRAHCVVDDVAIPVLTDEAAHHLGRVLRLRDGDTVTVTDGRGTWRSTVFVAHERQLATLEPVDEVMTVVRAAPSIAVGFALTKSDKPELVVQKLAELGVDVIAPFVSARSVVVWDETKAARNVDRWRTIAVAAIEQSRQVWLPTVTDVVTFVQLIAPSRSETLGAPVRADFEADAHVLEASGARFVLIGPEGGWSDEERSALPSVSFGTTVLRAETAAVVAGARLAALRARFA